MSKFDVDGFISEVDVFTDNGKGTYERRNKALESYLKYGCYKDSWQKGENEIRNNNDKYTLGADIFTSIKTSINNALEGTGNVKLTGYGCDIKLFFDNQTDEHTEAKEKLNELMPYYRAFSRVYYWTGNMIPVPRNFSAQSSDTWKFKLDCIEKWWNGTHGVSGKEEYENVYIDWLKYLKENSGVKEYTYANFISDYYLDDMVDNDNHTKPIFNDNIHKEWKQIKKTDNIELIKEWFLNNTKIIIQRSYRIWIGFDDDKRVKRIWEGDHLKNVESIMRKILCEIVKKGDEIILF